MKVRIKRVHRKITVPVYDRFKRKVDSFGWSTQSMYGIDTAKGSKPPERKGR